MTNNSTIDSEQGRTDGGIQQMLELMEAEIERLKVELEVARAGALPDRQRLIKNVVGRIDERQDALDKLQSAQQAAKSAD